MAVGTGFPLSERHRGRGSPPSSPEYQNPPIPLSPPPPPPPSRFCCWGGVNADGEPYLEPAFVVRAPPTIEPSGGNYEIVGSTSSGDTLFALRFELGEQSGGETPGSSFAFLLPVRPEWAEEPCCPHALWTRRSRHAGWGQQPVDDHPAGFPHRAGACHPAGSTGVGLGTGRA